MGDHSVQIACLVVFFCSRRCPRQRLPSNASAKDRAGSMGTVPRWEISFPFLKGKALFYMGDYSSAI